MIFVFVCFQSHCHILKELHEFLHRMGAITIFEKNNLIFNCCGLWIGDKVTWSWVCPFEEAAEKTNCQKMNVNF